MFDSVTLWTELVVPTSWPPKARLAGESDGCRAVPVSDTLCGLPEALSTTVSEPGRVPTAAGVKVTLIEQLAPTASVVPHVFVAKSPLLVIPEIAIRSSPV